MSIRIICQARHIFLGNSVVPNRMYSTIQDHISAYKVNIFAIYMPPETTMYRFYQPSIHHFNESRKSREVVVVELLFSYNSIVFLLH